jgi:hypothetical protein
MKIGVVTTPCGVIRVPALAAPSVASQVKRGAVVFKQGSLKRQNEERGGPKNMPSNREMVDERHLRGRRFRPLDSRGIAGCFADSVAVQ